MQIDLATIKANGLKALDERRLQFQLMQDGKIPRARRCIYTIPDHPGCGCIIGVSLPANMARQFDESAMDSSIGQLLSDEHLIASDDEGYILVALQMMHDGIVTSVNDRDPSHEIEARITDLRKALQP